MFREPRYNLELRQYMRKHEVCQWEIANALDISENWFNRKLNTSEMSPDYLQKCKEIVDKISNARGQRKATG